MLAATQSSYCALHLVPALSGVLPPLPQHDGASEPEPPHDHRAPVEEQEVLSPLAHESSQRRSNSTAAVVVSASASLLLPPMVRLRHKVLQPSTYVLRQLSYCALQASWHTLGRLGQVKDGHFLLSGSL